MENEDGGRPEERLTSSSFCEKLKSQRPWWTLAYKSILQLSSRTQSTWWTLASQVPGVAKEWRVSCWRLDLKRLGKLQRAQCCDSLHTRQMLIKKSHVNIQFRATINGSLISLKVRCQPEMALLKKKLRKALHHVSCIYTQLGGGNGSFISGASDQPVTSITIVNCPPDFSNQQLRKWKKWAFHQLLLALLLMKL